jgi:lambda repressor-like predicted transcriptional regulator
VLSAEQLAELAQAYRGGANLRRLATEAGVSAKSLAEQLVAAGVVLRAKGSADDREPLSRADVQWLRERGLSVRQIARSNGLTQQAVTALLTGPDL